MEEIVLSYAQRKHREACQRTLNLAVSERGVIIFNEFDWALQIYTTKSTQHEYQLVAWTGIPRREHLDFLQLWFQQISELFPPRQFWRHLLLLDLLKGFLSEMAQRCIVRFVLCNRLGFYRKRVLIELCLYCMKQRTCCCSHKGLQQNSNRPHSQWCVEHLSPITPYPSYLSCALCILLEQDNIYYKLSVN